MSERSERMSELTSEWPSTYGFLVVCRDGVWRLVWERWKVGGEKGGKGGEDIGLQVIIILTVYFIHNSYKRQLKEFAQDWTLTFKPYSLAIQCRRLVIRFKISTLGTVSSFNRSTGFRWLGDLRPYKNKSRKKKSKVQRTEAKSDGHDTLAREEEKQEDGEKVAWEKKEAKKWKGRIKR